MNKNALILYAEDNDDHAELVLRSLRRSGFSVPIVRVRNGEEALDYLFGKKGGERVIDNQLPDVIFLDLRMPKVDGLEVLRVVKSTETLKRIPVVILTTSTAESDRTQSYDLCANAYVVKPVDFNKFNEVIKELGLFWLVHNMPPPPCG